jgi:23S rRNA (cytosine1962-C5)-methyltransferase
MAKSVTPTVKIGSRGRARLAGGHPWIYRQDVLAGPERDARTDGPALVLVTDERTRPIGIATWSADSPVALRILDRLNSPLPATRAPRSGGGRGGGEGPEAPNGGEGQGEGLPDLVQLVENRIEQAQARRSGLALDRDAFRVVHGESDALPGLFIDVYADAAVMQTTSVAMNAHRKPIAAIAQKLLGVRLVIARDDGSARDFEGLPRNREILCGSGSAKITYRLGSNRLTADLLTDSKTGGFLDQADNHALVAALAPEGARCLDAFTYHGGFALALARKGGAVLATDEDAQAVARTSANATRNGLPNLTARQANAFDLLRSLEAERERFDVVVLDPPALAKRKSSDNAAERAYREIILRGLRLAVPDGLVVACSCSGRISREQFDHIVAEASADSGRAVQILARMGAGRDHPELVGVPETGHLKCWILRAL